MENIIILKWILKKVGWQIDDLIHVAEGSFCARLLWILGNFGFHLRCDILLVTEWLVASQDWLCSVELVLIGQLLTLYLKTICIFPTSYRRWRMHALAHYSNKLWYWHIISHRLFLDILCSCVRGFWVDYMNRKLNLTFFVKCSTSRFYNHVRNHIIKKISLGSNQKESNNGLWVVEFMWHL